MLAVQKDVYSAYHRFLAQQSVGAKGASQTAVSLLKDWNGQMEKDQPAPMLASLLSEQLRMEIGKRAAGHPVPADSPFTAAAVEQLLRTRPREWFADWDAVIVRALNAALDEGSRMQGRNPQSWRYGRMITLNLRHPVLSRIPYLSEIPLIGRYLSFGTGEALMSGASTTVKQTTARLGPSMRFVADLSDWDKSLNNLTLGQSGHVFSSHFKDQWSAYWAGTSFPMRWKVSGGDVLAVRPVSPARD
jgi:penicillin amidase